MLGLISCLEEMLEVSDSLGVPHGIARHIDCLALVVTDVGDSLGDKALEVMKWKRRMPGISTAH